MPLVLLFYHCSNSLSLDKYKCRHYLPYRHYIVCAHQVVRSINRGDYQKQDSYFILSCHLRSQINRQTYRGPKGVVREQKQGKKMERDSEMKSASKFKRVCVFCGSSQGKKPSYQEAAIELGKVLVISLSLSHRNTHTHKHYVRFWFSFVGL